MKRSPFKRKPGASLSSFKRAKPMTRSSGIKKRARKAKPWHDKAALDACRGQDCWLRVPGICRLIPRDPRVIPAHSNWAEHGHSMARKADDKYTVPACDRCHYWLDFGPAPREEKRQAFLAAYGAWSAYRDRSMAVAA